MSAPPDEADLISGNTRNFFIHDLPIGPWRDRYAGPSQDRCALLSQYLSVAVRIDGNKANLDPMQENLLQFIWQYSLYDPGRLQTSQGEPVTVVHPGIRNSDSGPDFSNARIRIGGVLMAGSVEIHLRSSDWFRHHHEQDPSYSRIILHVVQEDDRAGPVGVSVLELGPHIAASVPETYSRLLGAAAPIACHQQLATVEPLIKISLSARMLAERWEKRLTEWQSLLQQASGCWVTVLYWRLAYNFGFRVNSLPFFALAKSIPYSVVGRLRGDAEAMAALLFGQSGLMPEKPADEYPRLLAEHYLHLKRKHRLEPMPAHAWKFLRMRPANFPTVRIAQFAALLSGPDLELPALLQSAPVERMHTMLDVAAPPYWNRHYRFDEPAGNDQPRHLGRSSIENILLNTIAPIRFFYARHRGTTMERLEAFHLLEQLPAEDNRITRLWSEAGWAPGNAAESQGQLHLFEHYCTPLQCLRCPIGLHLIRPGSRSRPGAAAHPGEG